MKRALYRVDIDGRDITSRLNPFLLRLSVEDKEGSSSDTCDIELNDAGGVLVLPRDGAQIAVYFGWETDGEPPLRFVGTVDDIRSRGSRGNGMTLTIQAKGIDTKGKAKQEQEKHWDNATLETVFTEAAKAAGFENVRIDPELGRIKRDYWSLSGESFIHWGQQIAEEVGGTFKAQGKAASLTKRNGGKAPSGKELPTVRAVWGENLHDWDISPVQGRRRYKKVRARLYDRRKAKWRDKTLEVDDDDEGLEAEKTIREPAADDDEADTRTQADKAESERNKGSGSVTIEGEGAATPEGTCVVAGTRPGIDGEYLITSVGHELSRSAGWTTTLELKKPGGDAGKDDRGKKQGGGDSGSPAPPTPQPNDSRLAPASPRMGFASPAQRA